jgi:hypothetical protein
MFAVNNNKGITSDNKIKRIVILVISTALFIFASFAMIIVLFSLFYNNIATVEFLYDDAYYYLQIAYNLAIHRVSSFDGLTVTNGYQPLWLLCLSILEYILVLGKKGFFVAALILIYCLLLIPPTWCLLKTRTAFSISLAGGLLATYSAYPFVWTKGLETVLLAPSLLCCVQINERPISAKLVASLSVLFAGMSLIRLDMISLLFAAVIVISSYCVYKKKYQIGFIVKQAILITLPTIVVLVIYFIFNYKYFGSPVPVSGLAKTLGAQILSNWGILSHYLYSLINILKVAPILLLMEFILGRWRGGEFFYIGIVVLFFSIIIQYVYYAAFSGWYVWPWYHYGSALIYTLVVARIIYIGYFFSDELISEKVIFKTMLFIVAIIGLIIIKPVRYYKNILAEAYREEHSNNILYPTFNKYSLLDLNNDYLEMTNLIIAMGDRAGALGYWARENTHIFQTEGLVANYEYLNARKNNQGEIWIQKNIDPNILLVDRGFIPLVSKGARLQYLIAEPIQGRVVLDNIMVFCFPIDAALRKINYEGGIRIWFDFRKKEKCDSNAKNKIDAVIRGEEGIRRFSIPNEYKNHELWAKFERWDRKRISK